MPKLSCVLPLAGFAVLLAGCSQSGGSGAATPLKTEPQKFGYSVGYDLGHSMKPVASMVDLKSVEAGMEDGFTGRTARINDEERETIKVAMGTKIHEKEAEDRVNAAKKNLADSEKFLADMAKNPGVKTTADGLEYKVEKDGSGDSPTPDDTVTVNYKGTLPDGTVFDSSYQRGEPLTFPLKNVIPGWVEGLQLMKPGAKYTFYIPPKLAYGERGAGMKIGPNQALVFEVELLKVEKSDASDQSGARE